MTGKGEEGCPFYHRNCPSGCQKVDCRSKFPTENKVIMESQKATCLSLDYKECDRYIEGLKFREERRLSKKGCSFLHDRICGKPGVIYCTGAVPPFQIEPDNYPEACYGNDYRDCPNFKVGVAFAKKANELRDEATKNMQD